MNEEHIYFAQAGGKTGPVKIGFSWNPAQRLAALQTGNHLPIEIVASFRCENAQSAETAIHRYLGDLRMEGEWFKHDVRITELIEAFRDSETNMGFGRSHLDQIPGCCVDGNAWAVLWSHSQGRAHLEPLAETLLIGRSVLLAGRGEPNDYMLIAICPTGDEANEFARAIEPRLRAARFVRQLKKGWR